MKWIKNIYYTIRSKYRFIFKNKSHWKMVLEAAKSREWDYYYLYNIMYYKLKEFRDYFSTSTIAIKDYDRIVKELDLCIYLLEIITDKKTISHIESKDNSDIPDDLIFDFSNFSIVCDKYVNLRNADRFFNAGLYIIDSEHTVEDTKNKVINDVWKKYPADLYKIKASHLLFKILSERSENWWD